MIKSCSPWHTGSISFKISLIVALNRCRSSSEKSIVPNVPELIEVIEPILVFDFEPPFKRFLHIVISWNFSTSWFSQFPYFPVSLIFHTKFSVKTFSYTQRRAKFLDLFQTKCRFRHIFNRTAKFRFRQWFRRPAEISRRAERRFLLFFQRCFFFSGNLLLETFFGELTEFANFELINPF